MTTSIWKRSAIRAGVITAAVMGYLIYTDAFTPETASTASVTATPSASNEIRPLVGDMTPPSHFSNPYAQVPAQCYIETANWEIKLPI